jgi:large subunit ribosomal protein L25
VAYGTGMETQPLAIERDALKAILTSERGRNTIIRLDIEGASPMEAMVKEYEVHPLSRLLLHADLIKITEDKPIDCEVPFFTVGKAAGEVEGGTVLSNLRTLRVRCLPGKIPDRIEYDVSALNIDDNVHVRDLTLPESVEVLLPPERTIVIVAPPRVIEEPTAVEGEEGVEGAEEEGAEGAEGADAKDGDAAKDGDKKDDKKSDKK